tara:strand:+ start:1541 stop:2236 length:696 start_codon:yes stop_codon:yes gene_type:complete
MEKINNALILCAGYGKRLNPLTLKTPKPLLKVKDICLLENTINLINDLGIKNISINTFYLKEQIKEFLNKKNFNCKINIIEDGNFILDTGGGILNLIKNTHNDNFIVFNPDTIWSKEYIEIIRKMEIYYLNNKIQNILLVVNKSRSFDKKLKGDFNLDLKNNLNYEEKKFIYTGCQIINRNIFSIVNKKSFSIVEIWRQLINENKLYGFESLIDFTHITDIEIFNKLSKNQ